MGRKKLLSKIVGVFFLISILTLFGLAIEAFYSGFSYNAKANELMGEALDTEEDFLYEIERQIDYMKSHPEDTTLSHMDFISIILKDRKCSLSQQRVLLYRSAASAEFARSAFLLAGLACILAFLGWSYASRKKNKKMKMTKEQKEAQSMGTKGRKNIKKPKKAKLEKQAAKKGK